MERQSFGEEWPKEFVGGADVEQAYKQAVRAYEGGTVSPGGAAAELGITRQGVHDLISRRKLRAWIYRRRAGNPATYIEIPWEDVKRYRDPDWQPPEPPTPEEIAAMPPLPEAEWVVAFREAEQSRKSGKQKTA